jgi:glycolate oxidase iron-sulfur subunit
MHDMRKLAKLVKQLEDQLVGCMRCGMCQAVCPVFAETGRLATKLLPYLLLTRGI